jgi:hypothetical protein
VSTNASASSPAWVRDLVDPGAVIWDLSSPTTALCVAGDITGSVLTGTAP